MKIETQLRHGDYKKGISAGFRTKNTISENFKKSYCVDLITELKCQKEQ